MLQGDSSVSSSEGKRPCCCQSALFRYLVSLMTLSFFMQFFPQFWSALSIPGPDLWGHQFSGSLFQVVGIDGRQAGANGLQKGIVQQAINFTGDAATQAVDGLKGPGA